MAVLPVACFPDVRLWRLTKAEHAPGLDGEGARLWGGRWNSPGVAMVYCASSLALAALETLVHLPPSLRRTGALPQLLAVRLDVPDDTIMTLDRAGLPPNYGIPDLRAAGDAWIRTRQCLGLRVPSRVIAAEMNVVLNPAHPDMARVIVAGTEVFVFDDRLEL